MTQENIKENFSKNLISLRKANNLTQAQLAEKLNYTDKAVSKWEVGSVLPDVETMVCIAEFFGITLNDLVYPKKKKTTKRFFKNHVFITLGSFAIVWFLASIIYFVLDLAVPTARAWIAFIVAIPISFIVLTVFTAMWFKKIWLYLSITGMFWGLLLTIYLAVYNFELWFIFIIGIVGQFIITFWSQIKKLSHYKKK